MVSGINIVTYYAPTLFQTSLGMSQHLALLLGALLQVWYLGASFVTVRHSGVEYCRSYSQVLVVYDRPTRAPKVVHLHGLRHVLRTSRRSNMCRHQQQAVSDSSSCFRLFLRSLLHLG